MNNEIFSTGYAVFEGIFRNVQLYSVMNEGCFQQVILQKYTYYQD